MKVAKGQIYLYKDQGIIITISKIEDCDYADSKYKTFWSCIGIWQADLVELQAWYFPDRHFKLLGQK